MLFNITGIYLKNIYFGFTDNIIKVLNMGNSSLFITISVGLNDMKTGKELK